MNRQQPKLLDRLREGMRLKQYSQERQSSEWYIRKKRIYIW